MKAENNCGPNFVWILAGIPLPESKDDFEFYVIPSSEMAQYVSYAHRKWLSDKQSRKDSKVRTVHLPPWKSYVDWDISQYRGNWSLIEELLA
jgi:hypothetical protein